MRRLTLAAVASAALACAAPAWAVVGTTTVKVTEGAAPVPQATVTLTFKDQAGKPIRTVRHRTRRSRTPRVSIPDATRTVDVEVTTASGRTERRVGLDVALVTNAEIAVDVPAGISPPPSGLPPQGAPVGLPGPEGTLVGVGLGAQTTACNNWRTTRIQSLNVDDPIGENPEACFSSAFRGSIYLGTSGRVSANWLVGLEGDIGLTDSSKTVSGIPGTIAGIPGVTPAVAANDSVTVEKTWDASLRARFGYFVTPRTVVYATAGIAFQHIEATVNCTAAGACGVNLIPAFTASASETLVGLTVGGGVEVALTDRLVARGEYRYSDYGTFTATYGAPAAIAITSDIDLRTHTLLIGLGFKFAGV